MEILSVSTHNKTITLTCHFVTCCLQGGEYGTDEEEDDDEEGSPSYPSAIEVFDLAENEDMSPLETDPEKLAHKYKEVSTLFKLL